MPTPIYTVEFGALKSTAAGEFTLYVAPAGWTSVLRDLSVTNEHGLAQVTQAYIEASDVRRYLLTGSTASFSTRQWAGRAVIPPGAQLRIWAELGPISSFGVGYRFAGEAPPVVSALPAEAVLGRTTTSRG